MIISYAPALAAIFTIQLFTLYLIGKTMSKYTDLVAQVTDAVKANNDEIDSVMILLRQLHDLLQAAVDNQDFSAVSNVIKLMGDKDAELANAVLVNTPSDPNAGSPAVADPTVGGQNPPIIGGATSPTNTPSTPADPDAHNADPQATATNPTGLVESTPPGSGNQDGAASKSSKSSK